MSEVVIVSETEAETVTIPTAASVAETPTDAAVAIAEIEANRDIVIAEIHAETEQARTDAISEEVAAAAPIASLEERVDECQRNIASLSGEVANSLGEMRTLLEARLPPPPPPPRDVADLPEVEVKVEAPPAPVPKAAPYKLI